MKKIEAFIRPEKLDELKDIVDQMDLSGLSIMQVMGCGKQKGWKEIVRGTEVDSNFLPKIKVELVVLDEQVDPIVNMLVERMRIGEVGDGKIFISPVEEAIRIRTNERGSSALK